uniref:Uncharacterized protein n=1 Tax=Rhizophora mucronata TaxID=61149 RepID=A0A2P2N254_RHIMU
MWRKLAAPNFKIFAATAARSTSAAAPRFASSSRSFISPSPSASLFHRYFAQIHKVSIKF